MDGFDCYLYLDPILFLGFNQRDNFFTRGNLTFPPVRAFDREIVHAGDESVTKQSLRDFLRIFLILVGDVDADEFHIALIYFTVSLQIISPLSSRRHFLPHS